MHKIIMTALFLMLSVSQAADDGKFAERKTKVLGHIDQRITGLNEFKTCVSASTNAEEMKTCRKANDEKMKSMKESFREIRNEKKK